MRAKATRKRIEIDGAFAPTPQALILDPHISAQACRLWGVLFVFRWNDTPPDFDKLAEAMLATERSVYRWLQELESSHWIAWNRNAGIPDRFTLHTAVPDQENDMAVNSASDELIPRSKRLIPRSIKLTPVSEELTQVSIPALFDPLPAQNNETLSSDQKIQKIQNVGVGDRAREDLFRELRTRKIGREKATAICATPATPADILRSIDNLYDPANPQTMGGVINLLIDAPPREGHPYERPERPARAPAQRQPPERSPVPENIKRVSTASWKITKPSE